MAAIQSTAKKGQPGGYASLDETGKVPLAQLPELGGGGPHTHPQSDVTGLVAALDDKADSTHGHPTSEVSGLDSALAGKADSSHTHVIANITNLQASLDAKAALPTVATLASDQATGANVTPVTLTGLSFSYAINSKYRIWFMGRVSPAAATTGCGFQFDLSSAVTAMDLLFFHQLANTGTLSGGHSIADDASVGVSSGLPGTSTYPVTGHGLLVTGANTGTAQLRFRSETTAVITAKAGLTMVVEKIA